MSDDRRRRLAERGYNLVALMVIVGILLLVLGMALPGFELELKREREQETIFRGLQIAEAIRVFQLRQGRLPVTLEELLEVEPRSMRQLWKDPLTADGVWGLVRGTGVPAPGEEVPEDGDEDEDGEDELPDEPEDDDDGDEPEGAGGGDPFSLAAGSTAATAVGPIYGVFSRSKGAATILFGGEDVYKEWRFTPELLPKPIVGAAGDIVTRANAATVGRSFLYGLAPAGLSALEPDELTPSGGATDVFGDGEEDEGERGGFDDDAEAEE
ncbi:MAG: type II secretion system protein, partial [Thermoanaerobaculia bacterium]